MICLDEMLFGTPTWEKAIEFFKNGEFTDEEYVILAIKKYLRDFRDLSILLELDLDIADCLNGRYTGEQEKQIKLMYKRWNDKLGFQCFN